MFAPLLAIFALFEAASATPRGTITQPNNGIITPGPKLEARQAYLTYGDPRFLGWEVDGGSVVQRTCATGYTYSVQNGYFACCATSTTSCSFVTSCDGLYTEVFPPQSAISCLDYCITGRLYWSTADDDPYTFLGCGSSDYWVVQSSNSAGLSTWTPGVAAAVAAETTTITQSTNPTTTSPLSPASTSTQTVTPTVPPSTLAPTSMPTQNTSAPVPVTSNNGAIIGGAVGGCAIAIGLIVLGILLYLRRKKSSSTPPPVNQQPQPQSQYPNQSPQQDMRPMTYIPPNSPPPAWDSTYGQQGNQFYGQQKPYQYEAVAKVEPVQYPDAVEAEGVPVGHAFEMQGTPVIRK